jgi:hypothetical protein
MFHKPRERARKVLHQVSADGLLAFDLAVGGGLTKL